MHEYRVLKNLVGFEGIPTVYDNFIEFDYNILIMDLLSEDI
jgi:hypothetical protein